MHKNFEENSQKYGIEQCKFECPFKTIKQRVIDYLDDLNKMVNLIAEILYKKKL